MNPSKSFATIFNGLGRGETSLLSRRNQGSGIVSRTYRNRVVPIILITSLTSRFEQESERITPKPRGCRLTI
jgi:hypothetical protein